jgi:hypothetical protein
LNHSEAKDYAKADAERKVVVDKWLDGICLSQDLGFRHQLKCVDGSTIYQLENAIHCVLTKNQANT